MVVLCHVCHARPGEYHGEFPGEGLAHFCDWCLFSQSPADQAKCVPCDDGEIILHETHRDRLLGSTSDAMPEACSCLSCLRPEKGVQS